MTTKRPTRKPATLQDGAPAPDGAQPRREKAAIRIARDIVRDISEKKLRPGDKLLSEAEALERYNVSRGTLREAIRYLQIQGVIELRTGPKGGHFVAAPNWENLASTLALLLQQADASIESLIEARSAIEPGMAAMAAENASDDDITKMDATLDRIHGHLGDYEAYYEAYLEFWDQLAASTQNPMFVFLSPALRRITWTAGIRPNEPQREEALAGLMKIRDAVAAHDAPAAFDAMKALEHTYLRTMRSVYPREIGKIVSWDVLTRQGS